MECIAIMIGRSLHNGCTFSWHFLHYKNKVKDFLLVIQSILRKYIVSPSLIIAKNIICILLFQFPEWSEDLQYWNKEIHVMHL